MFLSGSESQSIEFIFRAVLDGVELKYSRGHIPVQKQLFYNFFKSGSRRVRLDPYATLFRFCSSRSLTAVFIMAGISKENFVVGRISGGNAG